MTDNKTSDILQKIVIRPINPTDSLDELTSLLHRAYKKLADQGFRFHASHQDVEITKQRVENAECYVGILKDKIVATIAYRSPIVKSKNEYYNQPTIASFGQFAVEPELQRTGIGSKLMDLAEQLAARDKATEIAFDTAEGAAQLITYYTKRGYEFVTYTQWEITNYRSVIMSKKVGLE